MMTFVLVIIAFNSNTGLVYDSYYKDVVSCKMALRESVENSKHIKIAKCVDMNKNKLTK